MLLQDLNSDILYEICKNLTVKDISFLQATNSSIYNKIKSLHGSIVINELKKNNYEQNSCRILKENLYIYLKSFLNTSLLNLVDSNSNSCVNKSVLYKDNSGYKFLKNYSVNKLYNKILQNFLQQANDKTEYKINSTYFDNYPNKLELLVLYNFINMECFTNFYNRDYLFKFLQSLVSTHKIIDEKYYDIKYRYYSYILYLENYTPYFIKCSFDQLYEMTPYITSVSILKKLFGYKVLDLTFTKIFLCCEECVSDCLYYICDLKMNLYKDELLCHNYNQITSFLKREKRSFYEMLKRREQFLVNKQIYITDPYTNKKVVLHSSAYRKLRYKINHDFDMIVYVKELVHDKNQRLLKKFFS